MNYYNPYFSMPTYMNIPAKTGLFSRIFGVNGINLSSILNGTQKVISFANQAIPLVKQVGPVVNNAKTMFKVMNEFKKVDIPNKVSNNEINENVEINNYNNEDGPTFFI